MLFTPDISQWDCDTQDNPGLDQWSCDTLPNFLDFYSVAPATTYAINPDIGPLFDGVSYWVNVEIVSIYYDNINCRLYLGTGQSEVFSTVGTHRLQVTADFSTDQNIRIGNEPDSLGAGGVKLIGVELVNIRELILADIETALTGLSITGSNVFRDRTRPHGATPALNINFNQDEPDYELGKMDSAPMQRLEVTIQAIAKGSSQSELNAIASEVEVAMYTDQTFGGKSVGIERGTISPGSDNEGDEKIQALDINYEIFYRTAEGAPDIVI